MFHMNAARAFFRSTLGKKYVMAITGFLIFAYVVLHMAGNLQIFLGQDVVNTYAAFLKSEPFLLWGVRIGLMAMLILHVWSAIKLSAENKRARPVSYGQFRPVASTYASRTMLMSGLIILAFFIYHILHFTVALPEVNLLAKTEGFPNANFEELRDEKGRHDVYRMVVMGFSSLPVSVFYIAAMSLLCLHLSHGLSSMFQSLGLKNGKHAVWMDRFARGMALIILIGNSSIPIAILLGYGR
jgi:succinate dehydrogenase / fumarate reductase cytochrome b subunit